MPVCVCVGRYNRYIGECLSQALFLLSFSSCCLCAMALCVYLCVCGLAAPLPSRGRLSSWAVESIHSFHTLFVNTQVHMVRTTVHTQHSAPAQPLCTHTEQAPLHLPIMPPAALTHPATHTHSNRHTHRHTHPHSPSPHTQRHPLLVW